MYLQNISTLLGLILNQYFNNFRCIFLLTDKNLPLDTSKIIIPLVNLKISNKSIPTDLFFRYFDCQGIVIQTKNCLEVFENVEKEIRKHMERYNNRRYLFLPSSCEEIKENDVFQSKELHFVADLLVMSYSKEKYEEQYEFLTHKYVGVKNNSEVIVLDKWFANNNSFLKGNNLYPDKISDMQGRTLRLATFTYLPYSFIGRYR